jgi:hypothetical protein|tara:strand:- start:48388 stop:48663 length:276 start_codon:yes stop_codon:yes gene_type:complete
MSSIKTDANTISSVLERLGKLQNNQYIVAFGPNGKQFIGTPNGYSAYDLVAARSLASMCKLTLPVQDSLTFQGPGRACWLRCQEGSLGFIR